MPDPVAFLGYWENEVATAEKVVDGWLQDLSHIILPRGPN